MTSFKSKALKLLWCYFIFKVNSKFLYIKICNLKELSLNKNWSFLQYSWVKPPYLVYCSNSEGTALFQPKGRKSNIRDQFSYHAFPGFYCKLQNVFGFSRSSVIFQGFPGQVQTLNRHWRYAMCTCEWKTFFPVRCPLYIFTLNTDVVNIKKKDVTCSSQSSFPLIGNIWQFCVSI